MSQAVGVGVLVDQLDAEKRDGGPQCTGLLSVHPRKSPRPITCKDIIRTN